MEARRRHDPEMFDNKSFPKVDLVELQKALLRITIYHEFVVEFTGRDGDHSQDDAWSDFIESKLMKHRRWPARMNVWLRDTQGPWADAEVLLSDGVGSDTDSPLRSPTPLVPFVLFMHKNGFDWNVSHFGLLEFQLRDPDTVPDEVFS